MCASVLFCLGFLTACAPGVIVTGAPTPVGPAADTTPAVPAVPAPPLVRAPVVASPWPIRVREHVDLSLHGFAMLQADSTLIPYFRRDYHTQLTDARSRHGLTTLLDVNADRLRARLTANPALVSAQFVPLYFTTWEELRQAADAFLRANGSPRGARDQQQANLVAVLAAYFPTAADRDWLQLFVLALDDERAKFYDQYWREQQRALGPVFDAADRAWRNEFAGRFARFLNNSQQRDGEILLSLPLGGEGRTLAVPNRPTAVAVGFPADSTTATAMVYVFAHEIIGATANAVVTDNTSPADRRNGAADRYTSLAAVRGGAMLLGRLAPELVTGYMQYYLGLARRPGSADVEHSFAATFPLPDALRDALQRQIDIILGGI